MNDRQRRIYDLKSEYCDRLAEGHDKEQLTPFDEEVISVLDKLFDAHRDVVVPPECASLGFVLKSKSKPEDYRDPCCTVPCFSGKMPYEKNVMLCTYCISPPSCVCEVSPMQRVKDLGMAHLASDRRETNDDAD